MDFHEIVSLIFRSAVPDTRGNTAEKNLAGASLAARWRGTRPLIAVFPILADVVEVKTGSRSTAHWSTHFIRLNGWLRNSFTQLITPLDIDGIGQNWEDSNNACQGMSSFVLITNMCGAGMFLRSKPSQASGALTLILNPKIEPNLTPTNPESVGYRGVAFTDDPGTSLEQVPGAELCQ